MQDAVLFLVSKAAGRQIDVGDLEITVSLKATLSRLGYMPQADDVDYASLSEEFCNGSDRLPIKYILPLLSDLPTARLAKKWRRHHRRCIGQVFSDPTVRRGLARASGRLLEDLGMESATLALAEPEGSA